MRTPMTAALYRELAALVPVIYVNDYKTPIIVLKARAKALKAAKREPTKYMGVQEMCDDIYCGLCYKFKNERSPWNRKKR